MKISVLSRFPMIVLGAALTVGTASQAHAQTDAPAATVAPKPMQTIEIPLRNADADVLAYRFNAEQVMTAFRLSHDNGGYSQVGELQRFPWERERNLKIPDGIASISSAPSGKSLFASGTTPGLQALIQQIAELDVTPRFVEVQMRLMGIRPADLDALKIPFGTVLPGEVGAYSGIKAGFVPSSAPTSAGKNVQVGLKESELEAKLTDLISKDKALSVTASRLNIRDGSTRETESHRSMILRVTPTTDDPISSPPHHEDEGFGSYKSLGYSDVIENGFKARPIIKDGFVALSFQVILSNRITQMSTVFKDGETLVVQIPGANVGPDNVAVALVTTRIVPRKEIARLN